MALLEVSALSKNFGGLIAVDAVGFEVYEGEIVSLIGPNGAGKTTIFNLLTGVYKANKGHIVFDGKEITNKSTQDIVKAGIARTFQNLRLFKDMRVIENVLIGNHIHTKYRLFDLLFRTRRFRSVEALSAQRAIDILESIGLGDHIDDYADSMPYGVQRKLEIARAMATDAKLLLLDEPAAGMNASETKELLDFIKLQQKNGYTILLIEHDMNLVMNISDRVYVLDYGKLIASGTPVEIANDPRVVEAYLGKEEDDDDDA